MPPGPPVSHLEESLFLMRVLCLHAEFLLEIGSNFVQKTRQYGTFRLFAGSSFFLGLVLILSFEANPFGFLLAKFLLLG